MALNKLLEAIRTDFIFEDNTPENLMIFIEDYAEKEQKQYQKNKENKALTFGKYKNYTVKELSLTMKGKDYLSWLLSQTWCTEDKFAYIHEECAKYKISKKKSMSRASLD